MVLSVAGPLWAATYYIDHDSGTNTADGLLPETPWQHCPGDANATDASAATALMSGDTVIFKGGVLYRGTIDCDWSGANGAMITYDGNTAGTFGAGRAMIDGSERSSGWTACTSSNDCGGNTNWQHIWMGVLPDGVDVSSADLYEGDQMLWVAQDPNLDDQFYQDDITTYRSIHSDNVSRTGLTDSAYFTQDVSDYWDGAYLRLWGNPNVVRLIQLGGFVPGGDRVTYADTGASSLYTDRTVYYAVANHILHLDVPGEFALQQGGTKKVWLWPLTAGNPDLKNITVGIRRRGIHLQGQDYITIQGFRIQKHTAGLSEYGQGMAIRTTTGANHIVIRDNEMTMNRSQEHQGVIRMYGGCDDVVIENNSIFENPANRGVILTFSNSVFRSNTLRRNGGTAIDFYGCIDSEMSGNTVTEHTGIHANGLTLYLYCSNCLVAYNTVFDGNVALTIQDATDITVAYNVLGTPADTYTAVDWGGGSHGSDGIYYFNNVMINDYGKALTKGSATTNVVVRNNILDGCGVGSGADVSHNIYTDLMWNQAPQYGWSLGDGELIETNKPVIFVDSDARNYRLAEDSPAIDAGTDVALTRDHAGGTVPRNGKQDIGAYEYVIPSSRGTGVFFK